MVTQKTAAKETTPVAYVQPHPPPPDKGGRLCRGEGVATHGLAFHRRSFSPCFLCRGAGCSYMQATKPATRVDATVQNDHFTVVGFIVSQLLSECKAEVDLVLIQTSFLFLWKLCLKDTSQHKKDIIQITKQDGLYQNKVNSSLVSRCNCKIDYRSFSVTW